MNNASRPNLGNCSRDIPPYRQDLGFQQRSVSQQKAQRLSGYEFPREVSRVSTGHVTIAMLDQPSQVFMREVLRCGDLGRYAIIPSAIEEQLQSYDIIRGCAVWPRRSGRPENYSLATSSNFGTNDVASTQRSFYIRGDKLADILVDIHTIDHVSGWLLTLPFSQNPRKFQSSIRANSNMGDVSRERKVPATSTKIDTN